LFATVGPERIMVLRTGVALAFGMIVIACSGGAPVGGGGNPSPAGANPNPAVGGTTTFHLVLADGPKAGTYDVSTTEEGACSTADEGYFSVAYDSSDAGLDYIQVSKQPNASGFLYGFDTLLDSKIVFTGTGAVTINVNDTGTTATVDAVSDENYAAIENPPSSTKTGKAELTVNCPSVLRPNI